MSRYSTRLRKPSGVAGEPLCGTCGGSSDTVSCGVPCSCRSRSYRTAPSSTMSSVHASWTCIWYAYSVK
ncbi:hypothetical protein SALBM311S_11657 [Streptomyces alboniger]